MPRSKRRLSKRKETYVRHAEQGEEMPRDPMYPSHPHPEFGFMGEPMEPPRRMMEDPSREQQPNSPHPFHMWDEWQDDWLFGPSPFEGNRSRRPNEEWGPPHPSQERGDHPYPFYQEEWGMMPFPPREGSHPPWWPMPPGPGEPPRGRVRKEHPTGQSDMWEEWPMYFDETERLDAVRSKPKSKKRRRS
jgi:hypothetical protein